MSTGPRVIILAAGRGERFLASGGTTHKLDALLGEKSVLRHVLDTVQASGLAWHLVRPEGGTTGMGDSIALGVRETSDAAGWLILPGDLPLIAAGSLRCVASALGENRVVVPHYQHHKGHPVGFGRAYFQALSALTGDGGAARIVNDARFRGNALDLSLDDRGVMQDVDTREDLHRLQEQVNGWRSVE